MSVRRTTLLGLLAALALPAAADKLDKESKKWLEEVAPIILPEEKQTYSDLKDRAERAEFEKIFWARRDTNLETPENEYKTSTFDPRRAEADKRFKVAGRYGAQTDCGRLFVLFGEPAEVKKEPSDNPTPRPPETWTYRGGTFRGGEVKIAVDGECKLINPSAGRELDRFAGGLIVNPTLAYKVQAGKVTKLADLLQALKSPGQALLDNPRQDFEIEGQVAFVPAAEGSTVLLGLVRADGSNFPTVEEEGLRMAQVTVVSQIVDPQGRRSTDERKVLAPIGADGKIVVGYRMFAKPSDAVDVKVAADQSTPEPGDYRVVAKLQPHTLKFGLLDEKSKKGSAKTQPCEVPNLATGELAIGSVLVLSRIEDDSPDQCRDKQTGQFLPKIQCFVRKLDDPQDPLGAFVLGKNRMVPRFGNIFSPNEEVTFFYMGAGGSADPSTGASSVTTGLTLSKGAKVVAKAPDSESAGAVIVGSVGPVPLEKYEVGTYTAKAKVRDNLSKKEVVAEVTFEIKK